MPVHAVVLPATALLVTGAAGVARPLTATRTAVHDALRSAAAAGAARWGVLAPAPTSTWGGRPSLAAAGIADRWVPVLAGAPTGTADAERSAAGVPASVALIALAEAVGPRAAHEALVVELADGDAAAQDRAVADLAGCEALVVAGGVPGDPAAGTTALTSAVGDTLAALTGRGAWRAERFAVDEHGPHLPGRYDVVTWSS